MIILFFILGFLFVAIAPTRPFSNRGKRWTPNKIVYGTVTYEHGQPLISKSLSEFLNDQPGKTVYWDSYKNDVVNSEDELSKSY